jgi:hypothetical protein
MAKYRTEKVVNSLPTTLTKDTIYLVKVGSGFDVYVTNNSGIIVAYPINTKNSLKTLPTSYTTNSITRVTIPEFTFPIVAGRIYKVECFLSYQTSSTNTGISFGVVTPTGTATVVGSIELQVGQTMLSTKQEAPINDISSTNTIPRSFGTSSAVGSANSPHSGKLDFILKCTLTGIVAVQVGSEVSGTSVTINSTSVMVITELN